jgi:hypothetical protein
MKPIAQNAVHTFANLLQRKKILSIIRHLKAWLNFSLKKHKANLDFGKDPFFLNKHVFENQFFLQFVRWWIRYLDNPDRPTVKGKIPFVVSQVKLTNDSQVAVEKVHYFAEKLFNSGQIPL